VAAGRGYGRGAAILSVGIGATGLVTFAYFSLASHSLPDDEYGHVALLWSAIFIVVSVLYRPVEQLLSRTIADHDIRGVQGNEHLRVAASIQLGLALAFLVAALLFRGRLRDELLGGSEALYRIFVAAVLAYAASYFARGFLAGHRRFGLYGGLVLMESCSRFLFALAVAVGIAHGQTAVALGMAAAPLVSLAVVPVALTRRLAPAAAAPARESAGQAQLTLSRGTGFALAVLAIMLAEQTFLNAGPLLVRATEGDRGAALAGFAFNVLLLARAPLVLFQAVQTSILPHLTRLWAAREHGAGEGEGDPFRRSVSVTLAAIAGFAGCVALAMLIAGPWLMELVFGGGFDYGRGGLVLVSLAMGLYLSAATLNQALLAQGRARQAALCWVSSAAGFVLVLVASPLDDAVLSMEVALLAGAACLCGLLFALYRRA
jgi:O-antigen/teichoic acid export membrane protein